VLDSGSEEALPGRDGFVEVGDRHSEMVDSLHAHAADAIRESDAGLAPIRTGSSVSKR
jgi:hypothetical protein